MSDSSEICVGLYGIGLETYWSQFEGLYDRLSGYQTILEKKLKNFGVKVVNAGLIDSPLNVQKAVNLFQREKVSLIFLYVSTYALSSTVLPVVQRLGVPVVVLNLQPTEAIDYEKFNAMGDRTKMTGEWLANCQACSVPEIANAFLRAGIRFYQLTGTLEDAWVDEELKSWLEAAKVAETLKNCRVGLLGHYYNGMLDIYSDLTTFSSRLGVHFEILEMGELLKESEFVTEEEITRRTGQMREFFDVNPDCSEFELRRAAKTSVMLDRFVRNHALGALAYFYNGFGDAKYVDLISSVIAGNSLLTARGVPVAGEYEVKNVLAMKILDTFGVGGSFTEFYAMDFKDDIVLMGHDGPGHPLIAEGKVKLKPLDVYHGKVGQGLSVEMSVKHGPVTLLAVTEAPGGRIRFLTAEGVSEPGPILEIGNTNSRYRFSVGARNFIDRWCQYGPAHHCAVATGNVYHRLEKLAKILDIEIIRVC